MIIIIVLVNLIFVCPSRCWTQAVTVTNIISEDSKNVVEYQRWPKLSEQVWKGFHNRKRTVIVIDAKKDTASKGTKLGANIYVRAKKGSSVDLFYPNPDGPVRFFHSNSYFNRKKVDSQFGIIHTEKDTTQLTFYIPSTSIGTSSVEANGTSVIRVLIQNLLFEVAGDSKSRVVINVVSDSTGYLFLEEGHEKSVTFSDSTRYSDSVKKIMKNGKMKEGDVVFFENDKLTEHTHISAYEKTAIAIGLIEFVNYYNSLHKPFWQQPRYYVPTALLISIATRLITTNGGKDLPGPPGLPDNN